MVKKFAVAGLVLTAIMVAAPAAFAKTSYYHNANGIRIPSPIHAVVVPPGATAECRDLTFSFSLHRQGTCSYHGGVLKWLK